MAKENGKAGKKEEIVKVKHNPESPEAVEIIAESIIKISEAAEKMNSAKLSKRAIVLLLHDAIGTTKIGKKEIELVLEHLPKLKQLYIKK